MKKIDRMNVPTFIILLLHQHNSELRELRMNRNKIATVPASLQLNTRCDLNLCGDSQLKTTVSWFSLKLVFFFFNIRLSLLDLGNNKIKDLRLDTDSLLYICLQGSGLSSVNFSLLLV